MKKFAIITFPDSGARIVKRSKLLEKLPKKIVELYTYIRGPRLVDIVLDKKSKVELGNIYNIPTLHYDGEGFIFDNKERQVNLLIRELCENNIGLLSAPFIMDIFTVEDIEELNRNGIDVLDTNFYHLMTLYSCIPELLKVLNRQLPYMDVGVWRGDTDLGEAWICMLAPYLNRMTIGGKDFDRLHRLSARILKETGLSCEVTTSVESCIGGKSLSVITEKVDNIKDQGAICILSHPLHIEHLNNVTGNFLFYSGLLELPCEPVTNIQLNTWEQLALSNTLLYILNGSYRKLVHENIIDMVTFNNFFKMLRSYTLKMRGVVNIHETITYDRFRMIYFKNHSSSKKVG